MKRAYIVTGPESSGSILISKIITHVLGIGDYGTYDGHGFCGKLGDDIILLHRSQPFGYGDNIRFFDLNEFRILLKGYQLTFIVTSRDRNIIEHSKTRRFNREYPRLKEHYQRSREIVREIFKSKYACFVWSYETFMYYRKDYLHELYTFLNIKSDYIPHDIIDANKKYIRYD